MKKSGPYLQIICGFLLFIIQFIDISDQKLSEIKFLDLYNFFLGIGFLALGSYNLSKSKKK